MIGRMLADVPAKERVEDASSSPFRGGTRSASRLRLVRRPDHRSHVGGEKYTEVEQQCRTVTEPREEVIGYDVQYRLDGETLTTRVDKKPGEQVLLGERDKVVGYDVTWRYEGQTGSLVMDEDPGERLPIKDGVIAVAGKDTPPQG